MINKLRGINQKEEKENGVYDEVRNILDWDILPKTMIEYWNTVYKKHPNEINEEWNEQIKGEYTDEMRRRKRTPRIMYGTRNDITLILSLHLLLRSTLSLF